MATISSSSSTIIFFLFLFSSTFSPCNAYSSREQLLSACKSTRFPETCLSNLEPLFPHFDTPTPPQIIQASLFQSRLHLTNLRSSVHNILLQSRGDANSTATVSVCLEILTSAAYRLASTQVLFHSGNLERLKDARAWLGAALHYEYSCFSSLSSPLMKSSALVNQTLSFLANTSMQHMSNTLSMVRSLDVFGDDLRFWSPVLTERNGFWEMSRKRPFFPRLWNLTGLTPHLTVCRYGNGCLDSIQAAVDSAPVGATSPFIIHIKAGLYLETVRIPLEKRYIVFLGEGMGKTVISGSLSVGKTGLNTYNTATVGVKGDGFMAKGVTFGNTAGSEAHQAVAFRSDSDLSFIEDCEFIGNQDTLYASSLRQYYSGCRIQGNVDFIFGNSYSFFNNCKILVSPRHPGVVQKQETNTVTAQGRTDPVESTGFVFDKCVVEGINDNNGSYWKNPTDDVYHNYLGRPWKEYSRTVFIDCRMGALISKEGWMAWDEGFALETLYYGEVGSEGPGGDTTGRVKWSSRIPPAFVHTYSMFNFIDGADWFPTT